MAEPAMSLSNEELQNVLEPEFHKTTFTFGKHVDGQSRLWVMQPLVWKYERHFRRQVMPLLAATYKPFETLLGTLAQDYITGIGPSVVQTMFEAETAVDEYLVKAVHAVLVAQDKNITEQWVEDSAQSRDELFEIVRAQCELHKIVDRLGESLAERFAKLAQMMGLEVDLPTLKRLWKQVSATLSARITQISSTAGNVIGLSTESLSATMSPTPPEQSADEEPVLTGQRQ